MAVRCFRFHYASLHPTCLYGLYKCVDSPGLGARIAVPSNLPPAEAAARPLCVDSPGLGARIAVPSNLPPAKAAARP